MSQYAQDIKQIIAALQEPEDSQQQNPLPEEEPTNTVFIYRTSDGGVLLNPKRLEGDEDEEEPIIDSEQPQPAPKREPPHFLYFVFILLLFLVLDSADTTLTALMTPTVTVTIIPKAQTIAASTTLPLSSLQGRVLPTLTLSESQIVQATGKGHQDARSATGVLTFYNGLSTSQSVAVGTVLTGQDGISVATDEAATIPPANPPSLGETSITAHAVNPGSPGNIQAGDINTTLATGLFVKNTSDFTGGRNARDFTYITKDDIQLAVSSLTPKLSQSIQAALSSQLQPSEALVSPTCATTTTSDHHVGDEALSVKVTVSQTCNSAVVYNNNALQTQATASLTHQALQKLGEGYRLFGSVQVTVTKVAHTPQTLVLSLSSQGVWVYQINETSIKHLVTGKPRLTAIHLLSTMPGIQRVSIAGISDNQPLPDDQSHIHLLIIVQG